MTNFRTRSIDGELQILKEEIEDMLLMRLNFYPVLFEVCDYDTVNILAARAFSFAYPHWRLGWSMTNFQKGTPMGYKKFMKWW